MQKDRIILSKDNEQTWMAAVNNVAMRGFGVALARESRRKGRRQNSELELR